MRSNETMRSGHTEVLSISRRQGSEEVIGLYDVDAKQLYEFGAKHLLVVGRARRCDIQLADRAVSLVHCSIVREKDGTWRVEDSGSTNGVIVNDIRTSAAKIRPGTWLFLGRTELIVMGTDRKLPIAAKTHSSFIAKALRYYGSVRRAAAGIGKSRTTIWRAGEKRRLRKGDDE